MTFSTTDQPMLRVRLAAGNGIDLSGDYDLIDREFKRRLERIAGVARVDVSGAMPNEVEIAIAPERLTAHDIGLNELAQRLQEPNFSVSAGEIADGGRRLRVQPVGAPFYRTPLTAGLVTDAASERTRTGWRRSVAR